MLNRKLGPQKNLKRIRETWTLFIISRYRRVIKLKTKRNWIKNWRLVKTWKMYSKIMQAYSPFAERKKSARRRK